WSILRRFASARWSCVLVLLYFLATSVRTVSSQALWQHPGVHLAVATALWLTLREETVPLRREFLAGLALGVGTIVRQTTALVTLFLYATYTEWWGGRVFGARFLDDLAPVLFAAIAWGTGAGLLRSRLSHVVFAALAAWSLLIFNAAALVYDQSWDTTRGINFDPSPLFSWTDPQWLAVLAALPAGGSRVIAGGLLSMLVVALFLRLELRALRPEGSAD